MNPPNEGWRVGVEADGKVTYLDLPSKENNVFQSETLAEITAGTFAVQRKHKPRERWFWQKQYANGIRGIPKYTS